MNWLKFDVITRHWNISEQSAKDISLRPNEVACCIHSAVSRVDSLCHRLHICLCVCVQLDAEIKSAFDFVGRTKQNKKFFSYRVVVAIKCCFYPTAFNCKSALLRRKTSNSERWLCSLRCACNTNRSMSDRLKWHNNRGTILINVNEKIEQDKHKREISFDLIKE